MVIFLAISFLRQSQPDLTGLSDSELLERYLNSWDGRYVAELFSRYVTLVYGVCRKYADNENDAQDLVMDIFESLLQKLKQESPLQFRSWLYVVSKNKGLMFVRTKRSVGISSIPEMGNMEFPGELHPEEEHEIQLAKLMENLHQLPEGQQVCLRLFFLEEKSYQQISTETGLGLSAVKSFIQNGKRNLSIKMEKGRIL